MGCVSYTTRFFADGQLSTRHFERALTAARQELASIAEAYRELGWDVAIGSSGTIKAVCQVLQQAGLASPQGHITAAGLHELRRQLLRLGHVSEISLPGLKEDRKPILPAASPSSVPCSRRWASRKWRIRTAPCAKACCTTCWAGTAMPTTCATVPCRP